MTGQPLADFDFTYPSYVNGPSGTQLGMEYTAKVALTFLPWIFRHTGVDANYSELDFENFATSQDLMTGEFNPPQGQRSYFKNFTVWYDDGKFNARAGLPGPIRVLRLHLVLLERHQQLPDVVRAMPGPDDPYALQSRRHELSRGHGILRSEIELPVQRALQHVFFSGRNITREATYRTIQPNNVYSDGAPTLEQFSYGGARWQIGATWEN